MIFLGIGSNLSSGFGDRFKNIDMAISFLKDYQLKIAKISSYYESDSYPDKSNPKFINIVLSVESNIKPEKLADYILSTELKLERKREKKNDPRTCDIDIIDFNQKKINFRCNNLCFTVPHKKLNYRSFVLMPLKELSPNWNHPVSKEHIDVLLKKLSNEEKKSILKVNKS